LQQKETFDDESHTSSDDSFKLASVKDSGTCGNCTKNKKFIDKGTNTVAIQKNVNEKYKDLEEYEMLYLLEPFELHVDETGLSDEVKNAIQQFRTRIDLLRHFARLLFNKKIKLTEQLENENRLRMSSEKKLETMKAEYELKIYELKEALMRSEHEKQQLIEDLKSRPLTVEGKTEDENIRIVTELPCPDLITRKEKTLIKGSSIRQEYRQVPSISLKLDIPPYEQRRPRLLSRPSTAPAHRRFTTLDMIKRISSSNRKKDFESTGSTVFNANIQSQISFTTLPRSQSSASFFHSASSSMQQVSIQHQTQSGQHDVSQYFPSIPSRQHHSSSYLRSSTPSSNDANDPSSYNKS